MIRTPERDALRAFLAGRSIETGIHYPVPAHRQPAVRHLGAPPLPTTERLVDEILSLPISAGHTEAEIDEWWRPSRTTSAVAGEQLRVLEWVSAAGASDR